MTLLQNGFLQNQLPLTWTGGLTGIGKNRNGFNAHGLRLNLSSGLTNATASVPGGCEPPTAWVLGREGGGLAAYNTINGIGEISAAALTMGRALSADLIGDGTISAASLALIVSLLADLAGESALSAEMRGAIQMASSLAGSGDIAAALGVIAWCTCSLVGEGLIDATLRGTATLACDITSYGALTPEGLRDAVWDAIATSYNESGTMGEKVNAAGTAGDPWTTVLPGSYTGAQAGKLIGDNLDTAIGNVPAAVLDEPLSGHTIAGTLGEAAASSPYQAKVWPTDVDTADNYIVTWFYRGEPLSSGVTLAKIRVVKATDASDLIAETYMAEIGSLGTFQYTTANQMQAGEAYLIILTAVIDGEIRNWMQPYGRPD